MTQLIRRPDGMRYVDAIEGRTAAIERQIAGDISLQLAALTVESAQNVADIVGHTATLADHETRLAALELKPFFYAYLNVAIASHYPAGGTFAKVPTDSWGTGSNSDGMAAWDLTNDQMVIGAAQQGVWQFHVSALENEAQAVGNSRVLSMFVNTGEYLRMNFDTAASAGNATISASATAWLQSGWTVDFRAAFVRAAASTAGAGYQYTHIIGVKLSD